MWLVVGVLLAVGAVALLVRRFRQGDVASRWLAVTAVAWGAAFALQDAGAGAVTPAAIQLTLADLLAILGLPALGLALLRLAQAANAEATVRLDSIGRSWGSGQVTDGCLVSLSAFALGWITILRHAYLATTVGAGSFAVDLVHPATDLVVVAGTLWLAVQAGRRGAAPFLALCAATVGDLLVVQARAAGMHPGAGAELAWLVAIVLLGLSALPLPAAPRPGVSEATAAATEPPVTTLIALATASLAAVVTLIFGIVTWGHSGTLPLIAAAVLILALIGRITGLLRQAAAMSALAAQSGSQFHQLADRTSDVVLLCDADGVISYASTAVSRYGYAPGELAGTQLPELVHPDDLANALQAAAAVHPVPMPAPGAFLPGPGLRRDVAACPGNPVAVFGGGPAGSAARDRTRRQRSGSAAPAGHSPDLSRRADRPAEPLLPGGASQGPARQESGDHGADRADRGDLRRPRRLHRHQ